MKERKYCDDKRHRIYPAKRSPLVMLGPTHWISDEIKNPHNPKERIWSKKLVRGPLPK